MIGENNKGRLFGGEKNRKGTDQSSFYFESGRYNINKWAGRLKISPGFHQPAPKKFPKKNSALDRERPGKEN